MALAVLLRAMSRSTSHMARFMLTSRDLVVEGERVGQCEAPVALRVEEALRARVLLALGWSAALRVGVDVGVGVGVPVALGAPEADWPTARVGVAVGVAVGVGDWEGEASADAAPALPGVRLPVALPTALAAGEKLGVRESVAVSAVAFTPAPAAGRAVGKARLAYASAMSMGRNMVPKNPRYQDTNTNKSAYQGVDLCA